MCFACHQSIPGQIEELRRHFDYTHGLLYRKKPFRLLTCFQNQCTQEFAKFKDLAQHIRTYHLHNQNVIVNDASRILLMLSDWKASIELTQCLQI